ncbi:MAG: acetate kinase [Pseudomonadales bacterium]|nr:acetate kinase [Pseudomonadales bacterium]
MAALTMNPSTLVTVNVGSSSVKLDIFDVDVARRRVVGRTSDVVAHDAGVGLDAFFRQHSLDPRTIVAIVHRVVHGGDVLARASLLTPALSGRLASLEPLAPLHNPVAFEWVRAASSFECPQVLAPDTAFFANLPDVAKHYAVPAEIARTHGLRRFGFHGLAHQAMRDYRSAAEGTSTGKVVTLQLGSGCSAAAIGDGEPVDTSMGFSPLEGLVMATRSGDIDPGIILWLMSQAGMASDEVRRLLDSSSGLLGVSGVSADMRELLEREDERSRLAIALYVYRIRKYIGAYAAVLGGLDGVVFGGGVGENSPVIRERVLAGMTWCGIRLDDRRNASGEPGLVSSPSSRVRVYVAPVDEARVMADAALDVLSVR